jgi:hypothetical protein
MDPRETGCEDAKLIEIFQNRVVLHALMMVVCWSGVWNPLATFHGTGDEPTAAQGR